MKLNGNIIPLECPITITELLSQNNYNQKRVAIELNGNIIAKSKFDETQVCDNDIIEIVSFVGGG